MASSPCCPTGSWGNPPADGSYQHKGAFDEIAGLNCYVTGSATANVVILSFSDVFACLMDRKREVCDQLAGAIPSSLVVAPDFYEGKPIMELPHPNAGKLRSIAGMMLSIPRILYRMRYLHNWSSLGPKLEGLVQQLRSSHPNAHFLCYGYCFGGFVVCKVCSYLGFSAGLSYHPSPQLCKMQPPEHYQTLQELASAVRCPILMLPAGNDPDNLKEGGDFIRWMPSGSSYTFENMKHGYMSRAASDNSALAKMMGGKADEIAAAQAEALRRTIEFFKAAMEKPAVIAAPAPSSKSKTSGGSNRWAVILLATALTVAVLAARKRAKL